MCPPAPPLQEGWVVTLPPTLFSHFIFPDFPTISQDNQFSNQLLIP